jgi:hypothetical protein
MSTAAAVPQGLFRLASASMAILGWLCRGVGPSRGWVVLGVITCGTMTMAVASDTPFLGGAPVTAGLPKGVAESGTGLSAAVAALVSASASAPAAAAVATRAFPDLTRNGLGADRVAHIEWQAGLPATGQWSNEVVMRCYMDFRQAELGLVHIIRVTDSAVQHIGELISEEKEARLSSGWTPTSSWGFRLAEQQPGINKSMASGRT